jgi:hypothetical protein
MTRFSSAISSARRSLGNHLARLRRSFDTITEQVREAIARAIGRTVAEAVSEAVHAVLTELDGMRTFLPVPSRSSSRPPPLWDEPDDRPWPDDHNQPYEPRQYLDPDADDDGLADDEDLDDDDATDSQPTTTRPSLVHRALAVGCRATAYWLDQHPGRFSLVVAVGVGVAAGVAILVAGPSLAGASGLAASAVALLALVDAVRSGTALLTS